MSKVSAIICVYNTEINLFRNSLLSLTNSSLKDIEIIVVNDGSTINYDNIKYEFPNIKWIETENKGTLSARITGIENATSPFVYFIDSDDELSFFYLEALLKRQEQTQADIVLGDWAFHTENARYYCGNDSTISTDFLVNGKYCLKKYFEKSGLEHSMYVLWNKLFNRELFLKACKKIKKIHDINSSKIVFGEDVLITYFAFSMAKCVTNIHFGYYFYKIHNAQQTSIYSKNTIINQIKNMSIVFKYMTHDLKDTNRINEFSKNISEWKKLLSSSHYETCKNSNYTDLFDFIKESFSQEKLYKLPYKAHKVYGNHKLLPSNLTEIENSLRKIYFNDFSKIYSPNQSYSFIQISNMKEIFNKKFELTIKKDADIILSKDNISFKLKLIHNDFCYKIGVKLFPKGSKLRKFLKSKL